MTALLAPLDELKLLLRPAGGGLYLVSTGKAEQLHMQRRFYDAATDEDVTIKYAETLARIADPSTRVLVFGIPSDVGAGFRRGANLGPQSIRLKWLEQHAAGWPKGVLDIGDAFCVPQLLDDDMLSTRQLLATRAALYPDVADDVRATLPCSPLSIAQRALTLALTLNPKACPLMLGGDHSTAWPVVKALHDAGRRFCIVHVDAHTDLLAERLGVRICFATWAYHANDLIGRSRRLIQAGIRATRFPRDHWEQTLDVVQKWPKDIDDEKRVLDEIIAAANATGLPVYFSNDIDGTDAADADATGTPEPNGLSVGFVRTLVQRLGTEVPAGLVGADLVEVAPLLGKDGGQRTLETAYVYLRETIDALMHEMH